MRIRILGHMPSPAKTASLFALFAVAAVFVSRSNLLGALTVQQTTPADEIRAYKLMNIPPNSTGSCKSRFGEGALAGKLDCECRGGFKWNETKTQCVSDGTPRELSYFERLTMRIFRITGQQPPASSASSVAASAAASTATSVLRSSQATKPAGCFVLATVTSAGDKLYFVPGCPSYDDIEIDIPAGEKRFCTEELAEKAGWKKSPACK